MEAIPFISETKVLELLDWKSTIAAVETSLRNHYVGNTVQPARSISNVNNQTYLYAMPGYLKDPTYGALACKLVTAAENTSQGIPNVIAHIMLFDESTGQILAIIAGTEITTWRTAAASVVATRYLARHFDTLAILGAGVQGRIHAIAFQTYFKFKKIQVWNRTHDKTLQLVEELNSKFQETIAFACGTVKEALANADVIVTATSATEAIVKKEWIKPGAHINSVGVSGQGASELEMAIYKSADVYVDNIAGAATELKTLTDNGISFAGEIGGLIVGDLKRETENHLSIFQSLGMAVEDCAMARLIYDRYSKHSSL